MGPVDHLRERFTLKYDHTKEVSLTKDSVMNITDLCGTCIMNIKGVGHICFQHSRR